MKCILIDDDPEEIEIFGNAVIALKQPVTFIGYTNFEEALHEMHASKHSLPNVIFLDGFMKRIAGNEWLRRLKSDQVLAEIPVIIYTGFISDSNREQVILSGASDILIKPNQLADLARELNALFEAFDNTGD
jgi:CheY-like chemotaxis protein